MNLNPNKLHLSKWTAVHPEHKEKHFIVTRIFRDDDMRVLDVELEAVLTKRKQRLSWRDLKDEARWRVGWE